MVFQHFNLFPHRTALENVIEAPIHVKRVKKDAALARAKDLLDQVGLSAKSDAYPAQLSGGAAAAGRHRPRAGDESEADAVRRADLGTGSRAGR